MPIEVHPIGYRVVAEAKARKLASGIVISADPADLNQPTPETTELIVVEIGQPKVLLDGAEVPIRVKPGDVIVVSQAVIQFKPAEWYGNRNLFVINVEDILATLSGDVDVVKLAKAPVTRVPAGALPA